MAQPVSEFDPTCNCTKIKWYQPGTNVEVPEPTPVVSNSRNLSLSAPYRRVTANSLTNMPNYVYPGITPTLEGKAQVRFIHAVPDAGLVDIYIQSPNSTNTPDETPNTSVNASHRLLFRNAGYGLLTSYIQILAGHRKFVITSAGTRDVLLRPEPVLTINGSYTFIIYGTANPGDQYPLGVLSSTDLSTCPIPGKAELHFINAAPGVDRVNFYGADTLIFNQVAYGRSGMPDYVPLVAGNLKISLLDSTSRNHLLDHNLTLAAQGIYTIVLIGSFGSLTRPLSILIAEDSQGACVIHE